MAITKHNHKSMYNLGFSYYKQNKLDLAEKYFLMAAEQNCQRTMYMLGIFYKEQNKLDLAEKFYLNPLRGSLREASSLT